MNYRHVYHAGNFADVFKHVLLVRIIAYLKRKDKAFRVVDTHAGVGFYDLSSPEAQKTGEWRAGIGRVLGARFPADAAVVIAPYLAVVRDANGRGDFRHYPGSPDIARRLLRPQDRLTAIERHPDDVVALKARFAGDHQTRVIALDGWLALGAHLPPKEHRGLVLVDPPFEQPDEFDRMVEGLIRAHRRWPGGTYAFWYPIKDHARAANFRRALVATGIPDLLDFTLTVRRPSLEPRLDGCGMAVANPPYTLAGEMRALLPALADTLADGPGAAWRIEVLTGEAA